MTRHVLNKNEKQRLEELYSLNILDTAKEEAFDRITRIASKAFNVPICIISLIDKERQWFKSCVGIQELTETSREVAFCHYVVQNEESIIIRDATKDERFQNNPLVTGELGIRFYAGAPLKTENNLTIGTLCIIDTEVRDFSSEQLSMLEDYATIVMSEIELRDKLKENHILSKAIDKTSTGLMITDQTQPDNPVVFVNQAFAEITGYSKEEVVGDNCHFLFGEETNKDSLERIQNAVQSGFGITEEIINYKKDGTTFWNELTVDPIVDQKGNVTHLVGLQSDISEKKKQELDFALRKMRYKALFHSNNDPVYIVNLQGKFIEVNEACSVLTGYTSEELLSMTFVELIVDEYLIAGKQAFNKIVYDLEKVELEIQIYTKQGDILDLSLKGMPLVINGKLQGIYGISKDITRLKEAESQLKITSKLFENMREGAFILDQHFNIITINQSLQKVTGIKVENIISKNALVLLSKHNIDDIHNDIVRSIKLDQPWEGSVNLNLSSGELKSLWLRVDSIVDNNGVITHYVCILRDLSEKEEIHKDVKIAGSIQSNLLPQKIDNDFIKIQSVYKPSQYVSGDFFDYTWIEDEKKLVGILYDAMGHGVATALQTSAMRVLFQDISKKNLPLEQKVDFINKEMMKYLTEETFVAAFYFELNTINQQLHYVPCGINEFFLERNAVTKKYRHPAFLIGMFDEATYDTYTIDLESRDQLHFITDGITDILPRNYLELFKEDHNDFYSYICHISESNDVFDDATALCITLKAKDVLLLDETVDTKNLEKLNQLNANVKKVLYNSLEEGSLLVEIAIQEGLTNAIKVATSVNVKVYQDYEYLRIVIIDDGPGFQASEIVNGIKINEQHTLEDSVWSESGKGIYLMKKLLDKVKYNTKGNQLTLMKKLGGSI